MKKHFKIVGIIVIVIISIYTLFILEESIRLSHNINAKPLIILNVDNGSDSVIYESIGFKLSNKYGYPQIGDSDKVVCVGQEIWLFKYFLIWGWIS